MKNKDCKIIQDLLPNYIENLTSEETNKFIESHVEGCKECKEILENMREDTIKENKINKKEVDYAKKISVKLKLFKLFSFIIILAILIFVANITRKYMILKKLEKVSSEYAYNHSTNFRVTSYNYGGYGTSLISQYSRFNDKSLCKYISSNPSIDDPNINKHIYYFEDSELISINQYGNEKAKGSISNSNKEDNLLFPRTFNEYYDGEKFLNDEKLNLKLLINIKMEEKDFNGIKCYAITLDPYTKFYFEKDTGLLRKFESEKAQGSSFQNLVEYYYEFNCLNDEIMKKPDISNIDMTEEVE